MNSVNQQVKNEVLRLASSQGLIVKANSKLIQVLTMGSYELLSARSWSKILKDLESVFDDPSKNK